MTNSQWISALVQPYGPQAPIDHLVREVNKLYHHFEAPHYDATHPEIHQQLPPFWAQMIEVAARRNVPWRILDFGCGSGFEAQQLLAALPSSAVGALTCYDPSLDMLDRCRAGIAPSYPRARFCSDLC